MEQVKLLTGDTCRVVAVSSFNEIDVGGCLNQVWLRQSSVYCAGRAD
jgi:hypothetical protein